MQGFLRGTFGRPVHSILLLSFFLSACAAPGMREIPIRENPDWPEGERLWVADAYVGDPVIVELRDGRHVEGTLEHREPGVLVVSGERVELRDVRSLRARPAAGEEPTLKLSHVVATGVVILGVLAILVVGALDQVPGSRSSAAYPPARGRPVGYPTGPRAPPVRQLVAIPSVEIAPPDGRSLAAPPGSNPSPGSPL